MNDQQKLALIQRIIELDEQTETIRVEPFRLEGEEDVFYEVSVFGPTSDGNLRGLITEETLR